MANHLSFVVGILGNIISILFFTSPMPTFRTIIRKKATENYNVFPYISTLLCCCLWLFYGILKKGGLLIVTVNAVGASFQLVYTSLFLFYAPKKAKVKAAKLMGILNVGFVGLVVGVTILALKRRFQMMFLGIMCSGLAILMYASPLAVMKSVIKTKSVKYMPFLLSVFTVLNSGVWGIYALLVKDLFIGVPAMSGFTLGLAQLILYFIYRNKGDSQKLKSTSPHEGSEKLPKPRIQAQEDKEEEKLPPNNV